MCSEKQAHIASFEIKKMLNTPSRRKKI